MTETVQIIFSGRVQGVFFRASAKQYAEALGIKGTVRNLIDGTVEMCAQGVPELIAKLERKLLGAFLCQITKKETLDHVSFSRFTILRK